MIGKWQGDWQGQWQGATSAPGSMTAIGSFSITGTGSLTAATINIAPVSGGGDDELWYGAREYYAEQERIAKLIRSQNQAIVAAAVAMAMAGEFDE